MMIELVEGIKEGIAPILYSEDIELVDIEYRREKRGWVLRIFIHKEGGVCLDDCENLSEQIGQLIDIKNIIGHPYTLEVSSPGLDRPLKNINDFRRNISKRVNITTYNTISDKNLLKGKIKDIDFKNDMIAIEEDDSGTVINIPVNNIRLAKLDIIF